MKKALLIIGIIGALLSFGVVVVSFGLHLMNPRNININEAMYGIVPGSICCALFFILAVVGLLMMVLMKNPDEPGESSSRSRRHSRDDDDE